VKTKLRKADNYRYRRCILIENISATIMKEYLILIKIALKNCNSDRSFSFLLNVSQSIFPNIVFSYYKYL